MEFAAANLLLVANALAAATGVADLPVRVPQLPERSRPSAAPFTWEDLHRVRVGIEPLTLTLDLGRPDLNGRILSGPYPFEAGEADYDYPRYRTAAPLAQGTGQIEVGRFFTPRFNANAWPEGQCAEPRECPTPALAYRVETGGRFYEGLVGIDGDPGFGFEPGLTLIEGPFVTDPAIDRPGSASFAFETSAPCNGEVKVRAPGVAQALTAQTDAPGRRHLVQIAGLQPGTDYRYQVTCTAGERRVRSGTYGFRTAPAAGADETVTFAFASDSREGLSGEEAFMGVNYRVLSRIAEDAYRRGAQLMVFGGDLIDGYSSSEADFRLQLKAWKKAVSGFWRTRPVFPAMGNHEALGRVFDDGSRRGVFLDRWPYASHSAEAVFADEFWNPRNAPRASDPRRPAYDESVYRLQYGPVLFLACNNNYWWTSNHRVPEFGGAPEGYLLDDQLSWVERQVVQADQDPGLRYVFVYLQEPVFPTGGHTGDAMWWSGDNRVRAYTRRADGGLEPEAAGMIEVRNRFWRALAGSAKVAAVLTGDEHAYYRTRIDAQTPVGVLPGDDPDGDGRLDRASANPDFKHPLWQITAGNAGAPFYARTPTPWPVQRHSSQAGYLLIRADAQRVSLRSYSVNGQLIDQVDDLMAIKTE